jgi:hypothetical protein
MTPLQKLQTVSALSRDAQELTLAGIRMRHGEASEGECPRRLAEIKTRRRASRHERTSKRCRRALAESLLDVPQLRDVQHILRSTRAFLHGDQVVDRGHKERPALDCDRDRALT